VINGYEMAGGGVKMTPTWAYMTPFIVGWSRVNAYSRAIVIYGAYNIMFDHHHNDLIE